VSTTRSQAPLYKYVEGVEEISGYRPGGYHPIHIGDTLHQRYRVVDKLGWGGYSTIWLARDTTLSRYVAVKVCVAASDDKEIEILSRLLNPIHASDNRGKGLFRPILDRFSVNGPNGTHPSSVATVARCSLAYLEDEDDCGVHRLSVVRSLAAQLATAVGYMHKQGFVHGGKYPFLHEFKF
jgi:serine/threonine protein kinase